MKLSRFALVAALALTVTLPEGAPDFLEPGVSTDVSVRISDGDGESLGDNHTLANQHIQSNTLTDSDANGKLQEVRGEGVVGEQPHLRPGEHFRYTSGTMIETPVGSMQGSYGMLSDSGERFDAEIKPFTLSQPRALH